MPRLPARVTSRALPRTAAGFAAAVALVAAPLTGALPAPAARAANPVTPGRFTGYGFDQCLAPNQRAMDAWLNRSPYLAVGIYISGASRGCPVQPNLTPTWVRTQLARGWRLLPITLGPQASCTTRERYLRQVRISPVATAGYRTARAQGRLEATRAVEEARRLGIVRRSTLWYDLEAFDTSPTRCRESALSFLAAWTNQLHRHGYVSGVYSSAASGIAMLDDARVERPRRYRMPDLVWIADWNGRANAASSYVRSSGWTPHRRVHQYRGGHHETYGGVRINIDSNWLDVGRGSWVAREPAHCGGAATFNHPRYAMRSVGSRGALVRTVQCLLRVRGAYAGPVDGGYDEGLGAAVRDYRVRRGLTAGTATTQATWMSLLSQGDRPVLKRGSASTAVRRVQRALNAADAAGLTVSGVFDARTTLAVKRYQSAHGWPRSGVVTSAVWQRLQAGIG
ncbi:MAG TPA: glycoside hydrolase domain-containing protein [Nocardioidaceae bacterium]|nr:glycoside hydrolase domain-containing protein [Nocardioidaceae bacterium]